MRRLISLVFITSILITGCTFGSQNITPTPSPRPPSGQAYVTIIADWNQLEGGGLTPASAEDGPTITHVGTRLVYPDANASFSQSVARDTAESEGIITLTVPPAVNAILQVVTVHYNGSLSAGPEGNRVLRMAVLEDLSITDQAVLELRLSDLNWVDATWRTEDWIQEQFPTGTVYIPEEMDSFNPSIWVTDPYQVGLNPGYSNLIIKFTGAAFAWENTDGERRFEVSCSTSNRTCPIQPYLDAAMFNLPSEGSRYVIVNPALPNGRIRWEYLE